MDMVNYTRNLILKKNIKENFKKVNIMDLEINMKLMMIITIIYIMKEILKIMIILIMKINILQMVQ